MPVIGHALPGPPTNNPHPPPAHGAGAIRESESSQRRADSADAAEMHENQTLPTSEQPGVRAVMGDVT